MGQEDDQDIRTGLEAVAQRPGNGDVVETGEDREPELDDEPGLEPALRQTPDREQPEQDRGVDAGGGGQHEELGPQVAAEPAAEEQDALESAALDVGPDRVLGGDEKNVGQEEEEELRRRSVRIAEADPDDENRENQRRGQGDRGTEEPPPDDAPGQ